MPPLMLMIGLDAERALAYSFVAASMGVRVKSVSPAEQGQTLGMLCGLDTPAPVAGAPLPEPMLVFAFLPDALLDRLLPALRAMSQPGVRLKAVLTPMNRHWSCQRLYQELSGEAAAMERSKK